MMRRELCKKGVKIITGAKVERIEPGIKVQFAKDGEQSAVAEKCIIAVGRRPVTDGLGLENIDLKTRKGFIEIDEHMETSMPGIFAIGDVTGKTQLAHAASAQGIVAAHNIAGGNTKMDYGLIPSCVYTKPEIACVGLTEQQAREKGLGIKVGSFPVSSNGRAIIMGETAGMVKVVSDQATGEILGCHIMAPRATDIIAEITALIRVGGTVNELGSTIHAHPTISEMTMDTAHDIEGISVHK